MGKEHLTSTHSLAGICTITGCIMVMLAGGIFLHPDFGVDKTNKNIRSVKTYSIIMQSFFCDSQPYIHFAPPLNDERFAHKWFSRFVILGAWVTCVLGLMQLTTDTLTLAVYAIPLIILAPFTLI